MNINTKDLEFTTFMLNRVDDTGEPYMRTDINIYYTTEKELEAKVISVETINLFGMGPCISFAPSDSLDREQTGRFLTFYKNEKHELNI